MSAKGNSKRPPVPLEQYFTPAPMVRQMIKHVLPIVRPGTPKTILEPSAGQGAIVRAMREHFPDAEITANDVDKSLEWPEADRSFHMDFAQFADIQSRKSFDLCVGNPPFTLAQAHIMLGRGLARALIFLVRQGFQNSAARARWFRINPPSHTFVIPNRPKFDVPEAYLEQYPEEEFGKWSTDSADYVWMAWTDTHTGPTQQRWLPPMTKEERRGDA